jgi:hypothetical protein
VRGFAYLGVGASLVALAACGEKAATAPAAPTSASTAPSAPLAATLSVHDLDVDVVLVNRSAAPVEVASQTLESAQLLLRVQDASGADMASGPPPTARAETTKIDAGARITRKLRLDVFSPPLPPGEYSVTVRAPDIESNTVKLRVGR